MLNVEKYLYSSLIYYFVCFIILQAKPIPEVLVLCSLIIFTAGVCDIVKALTKLSGQR